jgi:hypothetical protein
MPQELRDNLAVNTITGLMEMNERRCGTIAEASEMMNILMTAVRDTGSKGTLTLKFTVACDKNDELALVIEVECLHIRLPKRARRKALVFHDPKNKAFSKTDPRQMELLRSAPSSRRCAKPSLPIAE